MLLLSKTFATIILAISLASCCQQNPTPCVNDRAAYRISLCTERAYLVTGHKPDGTLYPEHELAPMIQHIDDRLRDNCWGCIGVHEKQNGKDPAGANGCKQ